MIEVQELTKFYGPVAALREVSFSVERGEVVGFLGPNGAGKTTAMRIITGYLAPTAGQVRVAGHDVTREPLKAKAHIGYLPERVPLYREMTARGYLAFVAEVKGIPRSERPRRIEAVLDMCGVRTEADRLVGHLSKGFQQRLGLAQALLGDPEVLILDEPTAGLDPKQITEIRALIRELGQDRTVILSTHILPEVAVTCQRVLIIHEGRLVAADTPANLAARHGPHTKVRIVVQAPWQELRDHLGRLRGVVAVREESSRIDGASVAVVEVEKGRDLRGEIARAVVERGWQLLELTALQASLEEVFVQLVTEEEA
jgi:ABC-2 type transport system ATP-binding protein